MHGLDCTGVCGGRGCFVHQNGNLNGLCWCVGMFGLVSVRYGDLWNILDPYINDARLKYFKIIVVTKSLFSFFYNTYKDL